MKTPTRKCAALPGSTARTIQRPPSSRRGSLPRDAQHFDASGNLTIKGRTRPVTVTVSVTPGAHGYVYDGGFELSRRDFGIGDPQWDPVLDDHVRVQFHLLADSG